MSSIFVLEEMALRIRKGVVDGIAAKGGGHLGGSLDLAELLAVLYSDFLRVDPTKPNWDKRDFLVCSKGHAGPALYAALALKHFFPYELLYTLNQEGTTLPGHCDRCKVPGIDVTSGSLGQGLSIAAGIGLSFKLKKTDQRVFCITGDGESAEGQIWEAAQFAAHYKLDNLIAFLDWNKMQIDGANDQVMSLGDITGKYKAFGWNAELVNGFSVEEIHDSVDRAVRSSDSKPTMIVLDTVKGGTLDCVSSLENNHCIGFSKEFSQIAQAELLKQAEILGVKL